MQSSGVGDSRTVDCTGVEFFQVVVNDLSLCRLGNLSYFCCRLVTFFKVNFFKKSFQNNYQNVKQFGFCWTVLMWVQTVCKGYQQMTKVLTKSLSRVNSGVRNGRTTQKPELKPYKKRNT